MSQQPNSANQLLTLPGGGGGDMDDADLGGAPPPWWRRRGTIIGIAIVLLIILLGAIIFSLLNRKAPVTYQYQQVRTSDLGITVSATGPLTSSVYNLVFQGTGGVLSEIDVKQGQKVTKGQIVAKLDKTSVQDAFNQQQSAVNADQSNLASAENDLAKIQGLANANGAAAQNTSNNSQNNLNAVQNTSNANVNAAQTTLTNAQNALDRTRQVGNASVNAAQTTLNNDQNALNQAQNVHGTAINQAQATLNASLATCNAQATATAVAAIPTPKPTAIPTTAPAPKPTAIPTTAPTPKPTVKNTGTVFFTKLGISLEAVPLTPCTQAAQATFNASVSSANATLQTAQSKVNSDRQALNQARATANLNNQTAQNAVDAAQQSLNQAQAQANQSNTSSQGQASNDKQAINTTNANGASSLASAQQSVITNQGIVNNALALLKADQHNIDNTTLRAPHSGIVTTINGTPGGSPGLPQNASTSSTTTSGNTFMQVVDTSSLQVQANVNETDTANLKIGEPATFTVNAYPNKTFKGTVTGISPNGQTVSNVVTFPVYIDVDKNSMAGSNLIPGMTANVTISVIDRPDSLLIPVDAINFARLASSGSTTGGTPQLVTRQDASNAMSQARQMLITLQGQRDVTADSPIPAYVIASVGNNKFVAKPVVLGLTDGTNYAVLEGLNSGDTIVVGVNSATRTTTGGGGGGGGGG